MPSVNVDLQPSANIDGTTAAELVPSGFISAGAPSGATVLGATAKSLEAMDESQLTTQVRFSLLGSVVFDDSNFTIIPFLVGNPSSRPTSREPHQGWRGEPSQHGSRCLSLV